MNLIRIGLVICTLFPLAAQARLGETREQCAERYGQALSQKMGMSGYIKNGMMIGVIWLDERVGALQFTKADKSSLSDAEVEALLEANKGESSWTKNNAISVHREWVREDGEAVAQRSFLGDSLLIASTSYLAKEAKEKAEKEKKALEGF